MPSPGTHESGAGGWGSAAPAAAPTSPPATGPYPPTGGYPPVGQYPPADTSWMPSPQPGVIPLRPLQLGELFDGTFRAIRANPTVMFGFSVALLAVLSLVSAGLQAAFGNNFYSLVEDPQAAVADDLTQMASGLAGLVVSNLGSGALTLAATTILAGILALTVSDAVLGRVTPLGQAWQRVRPRIWPLIGCAILVGVVQTLVVVLVVVVFAIPLVVSVTSGSEPGALQVLLLFAGFLLAFVAMAAISVRLVFAPMTVVLEDMGPVAALRRAWFLSGGGFWRVCGRLILIWLLTAVASGIVGGAVGILGSLFMLVTSPQIGMAITVFLSGIVQGLVVPISAAFETLMYVDERMRRENLAPVLARAAQDA